MFQVKGVCICVSVVWVGPAKQKGERQRMSLLLLGGRGCVWESDGGVGVGEEEELAGGN